MDFMTVKEVAAKLRMHPNTVSRYIRNKKIKAVKIGKAWLISPEQVNDFVNKSI